MTEAAIQQQWLTQIRFGKSDAIQRLYREAYHYCASFVLKNQGTEEDARETFQESLLVFVKKVREPGFEVKHSFQAYLYGITRNLWLTQLKKKKRSGLSLVIDDPDKTLVIIDENGVEEKKNLEARYEGLYQCLKKLKADCQRLLDLTFYQKLADAEVAPLMDYSVDFVRQKRRRCIKSLQNLMTT